MTARTITIFGSSLPLPGDADYEIAYRLAKKLAVNGFNICSGGSLGIMDAVSRGASEEGKEAIGVTVSIFKTPSTKYLTKEIKCNTLYERLENLITNANGFIILPGGTGTLLELALIWELLNKEVMQYKPIACIGSIWEKIVGEMEERVRHEKRREGLVKCFGSLDEVADYFINYFNDENNK